MCVRHSYKSFTCVVLFNPHNKFRSRLYYFPHCFTVKEVETKYFIICSKSHSHLAELGSESSQPDSRVWRLSWRYRREGCFSSLFAGKARHRHRSLLPHISYLSGMSGSKEALWCAYRALSSLHTVCGDWYMQIIAGKPSSFYRAWAFNRKTSQSSGEVPNWPELIQLNEV